MNVVRVGLGVLIFKDGKVLLGQRRGAHGEGSWCPPGGHLEFGESFEGCVVRETDEECGLTIKNIKQIATTNDIHEKEAKHYVTIMMRADWESGEPEVREPDRLVKWQWFSWDDLPAPLFLPIQNLQKTGFQP